MPMLPSRWNNSVAQVSLAPPAFVPELYVPLWWASGDVHKATGADENNKQYVMKGSYASGNMPSNARALFSLSDAYPATTKFALEAYLYNNTALAVYDMTAAAIVAGSTISSSESMRIRSSQFELVPGRAYEVMIWNKVSYYSYMSDLSLIVFP